MDEPRGRGTLSRERVLDAAMSLADAQGIKAVTMRKVAEPLGVEAMSLYNHVSNKADLLDGMVDRVAAEFERPSTDRPWREALRRRGVSMHEALMRHPWAPALMMAGGNPGPHRIAHVDATIGVLRSAGFAFPEVVDRVWNALDSYVYGFTVQALAFPFDADHYAEVAEAYLPMLPPEQLPHLHAMTVEVAEGRHRGVHALGFGLDLLLDGLEGLRRA